MAAANPNPDELRALLKNTKRIAIVGLSDQPDRTSNQIGKYLLDHGYDIIPVNPKVSEVFGIPAVSKLSEIEGHVDLVNVFRRSEFLYEVAQDTVKIGADVFWAQLGLVNEKAHDLLQSKGITSVMDRCIMVEHRQLADGWLT